MANTPTDAVFGPFNLVFAEVFTHNFRRLKVSAEPTSALSLRLARIFGDTVCP